MRLLLDTNILIWSSQNNLPPKAMRYVEDDDNTLYFSAASIWEIVIKHGLKRTDFVVDPTLLRNGLLESRYQELPVTGQHTLLVRTLPDLHKDPFDRILIAQAASEGMTLLTSDAMIARYPGSVIYIRA